MSDEQPKTHDFAINKVEIVASEPNAGELRHIKAHKAAAESDEPDATYIVKLYLESMPEPAGMAYELWIGKTRIPQYTQFKGGVYFKVYTLETLESMNGGDIRFRLFGDESFTKQSAARSLREAQSFLERARAGKLTLVKRQEALAD